MPTFLATFRTRLRYVLAEAPTAPVEFLVSLVLLSWGAWFCAFPDAFLRLGSYSTMRAVFPHELAWAAMFGALGIIRLSFIGATTFANPQLTARKLIMFWDCVLWIFAACSFFLASPVSLGAPTAFVFALASAWVYWRMPTRWTSVSPRP